MCWRDREGTCQQEIEGRRLPTFILRAAGQIHIPLTDVLSKEDAAWKDQGSEWMTFISVGFIPPCVPLAAILGSGDVEKADHLRSTAEDEVSDRPSWGNITQAWRGLEMGEMELNVRCI